GGEFDFDERIVAQGDAEFAPGAAAENEAAKRLGVEELVGKNDAAAGEIERIVDAQGADRCEGRCGAGENAGGRFGADFDEDVIGGGLVALSKEGNAGGGHQAGEDGATCACGEEVGAWRVTDALTVLAIVSNFWIIE